MRITPPNARKEPPVGLSFDESGEPKINEQTCEGCGQCAATCPSSVSEMQYGKPRVGPGSFMGCIACGHCAAVCQTGSITVSGRGMNADDPFGLPPTELKAGADQLEALLLSRRSIRRFTSQEIDRHTVDRIVTMTASAPMGIPPHEVGIVVFHGRDKVRQLAEDAVASFKVAIKMLNPVMLALMRPFAGKVATKMMREFVRPLMKTLVANWESGRDTFTYDAPLAIVFHHTPWGERADVAICATYAMLAAESFGLGACMLGTTVALDHARPFKQKHGIPKENKIVLGLVAGHPAVHFHRALHRRLASVRFA